MPEDTTTPLQALGQLAQILSEVGDGASLPPTPVLAPLLNAIHPSDLADLISAAPEEVRVELFEAIPTREDAATVLARVDDSVRETLIDILPLERKASLLSELSHDDAADVLGELPEEEQAQVLAQLDRQEAADLLELVGYPPDTAGGLMNNEFVAVRQDQTARSALMQVKTEAEDWETIREVFVVDGERRLVGVVSLDDLLRATLNAPLREIMEPNPASATVLEGSEEVANRAAHYRIGTLPVVDPQGVLVGVITYDDVMEALGEEASEDMYRLAGSLEQHPLRDTLFHRLFSRFPFLLVTVAGAYLVALVIRAFLGSEEGVGILRFVPMVAALAGNAGIQASTTMVRGFGTGDIQLSDFRWMLGREVSLGVFTGIAAGVVELLVILGFEGPSDLCVIVPTAQATSVLIASFLGTSIPFLCARARFQVGGRQVQLDPALAAGPFITTLNDVVSTTLALGLSAWMFQRGG